MTASDLQPETMSDLFYGSKERVKFGWQGYATHIERAIQLAELPKAELIAYGWVIMSNSPFAVACAEPPQGCFSPEVIVNAVIASGQASVSNTKFRGRERSACASPTVERCPMMSGR